MKLLFDCLQVVWRHFEIKGISEKVSLHTFAVKWLKRLSPMLKVRSLVNDLAAQKNTEDFKIRETRLISRGIIWNLENPTQSFIINSDSYYNVTNKMSESHLIWSRSNFGRYKLYALWHRVTDKLHIIIMHVRICLTFLNTNDSSILLSKSYKKWYSLKLLILNKF